MVFLVFFGTVTAFSLILIENIGFFGTVTAFLMVLKSKYCSFWDSCSFLRLFKNATQPGDLEINVFFVFFGTVSALGAI